MKQFCPVILFAFLAACATPEQIEAERRMREQQDIQTCLSYGLKPRSEAFGLCRMELDLVRQRRYDNFRHGYTSYHHSHHPAFGTGLGVGF